MISLFNSNKPYLALALLFYTAVLALPLFIFPEWFTIPKATEPLSKLLLNWLSDNYYIASIISIILIFFQALVVNQIVNELKLFVNNNFVPALLYITIGCLLLPYLPPNPVMLANTFIVLVISGMFRVYGSHQAYAEIFDVGFMIALASLFYLPALSLIILLYIALGILRAYNWREWLVGTFGVVTPYFLLGTYYFLFGQLGTFLESQFGNLFYRPGIYMSFELPTQVVGGYLMLLLVMALVYMQATYLKSQIQIRKVLLLLGWAILILSLSFTMNQADSVRHFAIISVPLSVILSYYLLNFGKRRIRELIYLILVLLVLCFQYYPLIN